jgi:EAL domain-containing protein (putative c-di-GMP-specific phosphodiesterase class I)
MKVLAEGVEEKSQVDLLNEYGCDLYQGYYFSKPVSSKDFISFLKQPLEN